MSKNKGEIAKLREKLFDKKKELKTEEAKSELAKGLEHTSYTIIQDTSKLGRHFLIVRIKFSIEDGIAILDDVVNFEDKAAGLAFVMNNDNLKFLFNKNKGRTK